MTAAHTGTRALDPALTRPSALVGVAVSLSTVVVIVALALLPLLTPPFVHAALDGAGSSRLLGLDAGTTRAISDSAVADLVSPAGSFDIAGPGGDAFFDASERAHLADARTLLWLALVAGLACALVVGLALVRHGASERAHVWLAIARGGGLAAIGAVVLAVLGAVAFGPLFTLFHQIAFPAGNWAFDPAAQRLVLLYPVAFWQLAAGGLGLLVVVFGTLTWWVVRRASSAAGATASRAG